MRKKDMNVALFPARRSEMDSEIAHQQAGGLAPISTQGATQVGTQIGAIVAVNADGTLIVESPGGVCGPTPARLGVALTAERIQTAIATRQPVVLVFENGDRTRPIVVGLIDTVPQPATANDTPSESPIIEADVDGRRVRVTAKDEIVLQCGAASVTLRRNGRIVIRGTYVETHSDGTNRIKGGQVQIN